MAVRRNRHRQTSRLIGTPVDGLRELAFLARRLCGDQSWVVELYLGLEADIGALPPRPPDQRWVVPDHDAAVAGAEVLCEHLRRGEPPSIIAT